MARGSAFQKSRGTNLTMWEYLDTEKDKSNETVDEMREVSDLAMVGTGQMSSPGLLADYPWGSLGRAVIVDVGGGLGSMCIDLAGLFPDLSFVVEDLSLPMDNAKPLWDARIPGGVDSGRVPLLTHDFFTEQPVKDADVYLLRYILHNWPDDACIAILRRLRDAVAASSRILVAESVVHPAHGSSLLRNAPTPLPANYGHAHLFNDSLSVYMLSMFNSGERTPEQFMAVAGKAGLRVAKIWECRGTAGIIELRKV